MSFLNPGLLFATLGVSVPIIIHLINRFKVREIDWAAMELLRRALNIRARQVRLEDIILLILRSLAVLFLALAISRPTIRTSSLGFGFLGGDTRAVVIAVDGSFSMAHRQGMKDRFAMAAERVKEILHTLEPGNRLSVLLVARQPRILLRNQVYNPARLREIMGKSKPVNEGLNLEAALQEIGSLFDEMKAAHRECYFVTDAQTNSWQTLSEKARKALEEIGNTGRLFFVSCGTADADNLALTRFELASGALRQGRTVRYAADVTNYGQTPTDDVSVSLSLNSKTIEQRMIQRIDPGETKSVSLFAHFDRSGVARLSAELDDTDALGIDDRRFAVAHVRDSVRVLCVDGAPSSKPYQSETDFLVAAFKMKSQTRKASSVVVHKIPWLELQSSMLQDYQVIILANVRDVPKRMARALGSFVERGGGLIVFLGDNINPAVANLRLASGEVALLPGELLEPVGDSEKRQQEFHLQIALPEHPLVQPLRLFPPEFMRGVSCYRFFKTRLLPNGRAILSLAGDAGPLLAEKAFGQGKVLLFTTTADRAWTNSVVHPFFPILMQQAVTYLTSAAFERQVTTGMPFVLPMPQDLRRSSVVFTDPQGNESRIRVTERSSARVVEYPLPKWPGFYHTNLPLRPHSPAASAASAPKDESLLASERLIVAANLESSESDVRSLSGKDLSSALEGLNVKIFEPGGNLPGLIQEGRVGRELWKPLLFLALLMLAAELGLGFWFARKMKQDWSLSFGGGQLAPRRSSERESAAISIESS